MFYVEAKHIACTYSTGSEHRCLVRSRNVTWPAAAAAAAAAVAWRPAVLAAAAAAEAVLVPACRKHASHLQAERKHVYSTKLNVRKS